MTAVHVMNNDVLLSFEARGRDRHPYELLLQLKGIEHHTTRVRRPWSNGQVERLHRTLLDEHFRIMGRKKVL